MAGPKKNNRQKNKLLSHRKNTSGKRFNSLMNDVYDLLERDRYLDLKTEYVAIIISGLITTDSTENNFDITLGSMGAVQQIMYKFRFYEKDEKYNAYEDPSIYAGTEQEKYLISLHPDAFYEVKATNNIVIPPGTIVRISDKENIGVYKIEEVLSFSEEFDGAILESGQTPISSFLNPNSPVGFLNDFLLSASTSLNEPEVPFRGNKRYSKTKSVKILNRTYRPYIRTYTGSVQKYKNTDIENGVKISDFHVKVTGYTQRHSPTFVPDIVESFKRLCNSFEAKFGEKIELTDGFRTWKGQISVRKRKPKLAAPPGTSNHGWGLAFDYNTKWKNKSGFRSETYKWMFQNAPKFGFCNPPWAQQNGSKPEAWHFEWKFPGKLFK